MFGKRIKLFKVQKISYLLLCFVVFSGCVHSPSKNIVQNKIEIKKQKIIKNEKKCQQYYKKMEYAFLYVQSEFDKGYFASQDIIGAKAQLFLIENNSPSIFSQNINQAEKEYILQYQMAKEMNCNLQSFLLTPLSKIKSRVAKFDNSTQKKK